MQTAATAGKQRVAAEKQRVTVIGNVAQRMPRRLDYTEYQVQMFQRDAAAFAHRDVREIVELLCRRIDFRGVLTHERHNAADMVVAVVGDEDGIQHQSGLFEGAHDRRRIARIDDRGMPAVTDQPNIVILESRDW